MSVSASRKPPDVLLNDQSLGKDSCPSQQALVAFPCRYSTTCFDFWLALPWSGSWSSCFLEDPSKSTLSLHPIPFHPTPLKAMCRTDPSFGAEVFPLEQHQVNMSSTGLWPCGFWECMRWGCEIWTESTHRLLRQKMTWRDPMVLGSEGLFFCLQKVRGQCQLGLQRGSNVLWQPLSRSVQGLAQLKRCKLQRKPRMTNNCRNLKDQVPLDFMGSVVLNIPTCLSGGKWAINSSPVVIKRM